MQLHTIKRKNQNKKKVSVGRGGKRGKTSGRGTKGQGARAGRKIRPEIRDALKRIPKLRGHGKNSNFSIQDKPVIVSISVIEKVFSNNDVVSPATLIEKKVIVSYKGRIPKVKILSMKKSKDGKDEEFSKKLSFSKVFMSKGVKMLVEKAGGKVETK